MGKLVVYYYYVIDPQLNLKMFKAVIIACAFVFAATAVSATRKEYSEGSIDKFPYHASIERIGKHACSGAIIGVKVIITTASCLYNAQPQDINVRVGSDHLESEGALLPVENLILHKRYQTSRKDYDLALIVLKEELTLSPTVQKIALPPSHNTSPPSQGTTGTITGYGLSGDNYTDTLNQEQLEVSVPIECKNAYASLIIYITDRMFCAELKNKHPCRGDSGSPLAIDDILVGISAWEQKCGSRKYPGIYTNIANLQKWIRSEVDI